LDNVKEKARWTHPLGDINKNKILRIIRSHSIWGEGIYQHQLIKEANLSRTAVNNHLKTLTNEQKIMNSRGRYVVTRTDDDIFFILMFEAHLDRWLKTIFTSDGSLMKNSSMFKMRKGQDTDCKERRIFEFANVVGAFIIYLVFIGKQPLPERTLESEKREYLIRDIIQGRILLENILYGFNNYFLGISKKGPYEEMNRKKYGEIVDAFKKVYPDLYTSLDQQWKTFGQNYLREQSESLQKAVKTKEDCKHDMENQYMFNFGEYLECSRCHTRRAKQP
jgi:hypothetical protein